MRTFHPRTTKTSIIEEYHKLEADYAKLEKRLEKFLPDNTATTKEDTPDSDISAVAQTLQNLQGRLRNAVGGYQNAVANELLELQSTTQKLTEEEEALKKLHNITLNGGSTLPLLVTQYEEQVATNSKAEQEAIQAAKLAAVIRNQAWEHEEKKREKFVAQRAENLRIELQRDQEEYTYTREQQRAQDSDDNQQAQKEFEAELRTLQLAQDKNWQEWGAALSEREEACAKLANEAIDLQEQIEKATKAAAAQGENIAARNASMAARMAKTTHNQQLEHREIELSALRADQAENQQRIEKLQAQLDRITRDNLTLSQGALTSSERGAAQALASVEKIAIAQTQGSQPTKR